MANFYQYIIENREMGNMPPIDIISRPESDRFVVYNKKKNRLDRIAGDIYEDETMWRIILWANPEYSIEFDIPDGTSIRIPYPKNDVLQEVIGKIRERKSFV